MITTLRSQVFSVNGRDAFELTLRRDDETGVFSVSGSLPDSVLESCTFSFDEFVGDGITNQARVFSALRMFAQQLIAQPGIEHYFFDRLLLSEKGEADMELYRQSWLQLFSFAEMKPLYVNLDDYYWACFYLKSLKFQAADGYHRQLSCKELVRSEFESRICTTEQQNLYVENYASVRFVHLHSDCEEPSFYAALRGNDVLMAFLKYSASVFPDGNQTAIHPWKKS